MYALAFDFNVRDLEVHYGPKIDACNDIAREFLEEKGFSYVRDGLYHRLTDDIGVMFQVIGDLTVIGWFPPSLRSIEVVAVEQGQ
jgi:virulence-associated protein VapD